MIDKSRRKGRNHTVDIDEILNRRELLKRLDHDLELLRELYELFLEDYPKLLRDIEEAIQQKKPGKLKRTAHTLKGAVGNFCADEAVEAAYKLEKSGMQSVFSTAAEDFMTLITAVENVRDALEGLLKELE